MVAATVEDCGTLGVVMTDWTGFRVTATGEITVGAKKGSGSPAASIGVVNAELAVTIGADRADASAPPESDAPREPAALGVPLSLGSEAAEPDC